MTWVASAFEGCLSYKYELVAAGVDGDLAYTCGFERNTAIRPNGEIVRDELQATQIYRREDWVWRIPHRHRDHRGARRPRRSGDRVAQRGSRDRG